MADEQAPDEPVNPWAHHAAHGATPETLAALATADPTTLTGAELVDAINAAEKALSLLAGQQMRLLAALAVPFIAGDPMRLATRLARKNVTFQDDAPERIELCVPEAAACLASAEVAAALRISPITAGNRIREAQAMMTTLLPTLHALEHGQIDRGKARVIIEHSRPLNPDHIRELQEIVVPEADTLTTAELRDLTGQTVIAIDPDGAQERHLAAAARRELILRAQPDAMATLSALLPADGAVKIFQISDLLATSSAGVPGDDRGIGARRIDALVDIADQLLTHGQLDLTYYLDHPLPEHATPSRPTKQQASTDTTAPDKKAGHEAKTQPQAKAQPQANDDAGDAERATTPPPSESETSNNGSAPDAMSDDVHPADSGDPATATIDGTDPEQPDHRRDINCPETDPEAAREFAQQPPDESTLESDASIEGSAQNLPTTTETVVTPNPPDGVEPDGSCDSSGTADSVDADTPRARPANDSERSSQVLSRQGRRPHLSVTIGLDTLAGHNELPALLAGFGAIPACLGRTIAKSAGTVTALLTEPTTGLVTKAGDLTYRPSQWLRDQIAALHPTCQFPSCRQPVWRCDIDH